MPRRLLFLAHRPPWPPDKGEKIRGWNVLRHLAQRFEVHLGCLDEAPGPPPPELAALCADIGIFGMTRRAQLLRAALRARPGRPLMPDFYHHPGLARWTRDTLAAHRFDVAYIFSVAMAPYLLPRGAAPGPRLLLDAMDIDSEKWAQYAHTTRFPMRSVWAREGRTLLAYERRAAAQADATFFVSDPEAARFLELAPDLAGRVTAIENGVDLDRFRPGLGLPDPMGPGTHFVFTGHMDYWPNADAAIWFATDILPRLRARRPDAQFWAVGANPSPAVQALAALPGAHVTGRVPDTRPYVEHATAAVCPLRIARGIQNKVLEAMAMGRPTVASPGAFEGVRAAAGHDLLVADTAEAFAAACAAIAAGEHPALGARARVAMERHYAWAATLARLDPFLSETWPAPVAR